MKLCPVTLVLVFAVATAGFSQASAANHPRPAQHIVFNLSGNAMAQDFAGISGAFTNSAEGAIAVGVGGIFSYLRASPATVEQELREFLRLSALHDLPVVVQLDGEQWWEARPDLWNWWDETKPGFTPSNRFNVEWSGWQPEDAVRIAWRNWGRIIRVLPPPNLMSPTYRAACHAEMKRLVPVILDWWWKLPAEKRWLLIGIKVGWESSIGVNAWYYPEGNRLADQPATHDPTNSVKDSEVPARGMTQIGYAAVATAGLRSAGEITEADLAEVVRRHLENLCRIAANLGVPREKLFTHVGGWKENELLYGAAVNPFSCPGWSFYRHAADPRLDVGVQTALSRNDAPYWAAVEWLFQGQNKITPWRQALDNAFADPHCRFLCIYNWEDIQKNTTAQEAVRQVMARSRMMLK